MSMQGVDRGDTRNQRDRLEEKRLSGHPCGSSAGDPGRASRRKILLLSLPVHRSGVRGKQENGARGYLGCGGERLDCAVATYFMKHTGKVISWAWIGPVLTGFTSCQATIST
jgi:hypothetical protein